MIASRYGGAAHQGMLDLRWLVASGRCKASLALLILGLLILPRFVCAGEEEPIVKRDPFWPVGYHSPASDDEEIDETEAQFRAIAQQIEWPNLPIRGRARGPDGSHRVLIERVGIVRAGDRITLRSGDYWFHWRITMITEQGIHFIRLGITNEADPGEAWFMAQENDPENYEERQQ